MDAKLAAAGPIESSPLRRSLALRLQEVSDSRSGRSKRARYRRPWRKHLKPAPLERSPSVIQFLEYLPAKYDVSQFSIATTKRNPRLLQPVLLSNFFVNDYEYGPPPFFLQKDHQRQPGANLITHTPAAGRKVGFFAKLNSFLDRMVRDLAVFDTGDVCEGYKVNKYGWTG